MNLIESHIRGLIFDCDGTLVDTIPSHLKAYQEVLQSLNLQVPDAFLVKQAGYSDFEIMTKVKEVYGGDFDAAEQAQRKDDLLLEKYFEQVGPIDQVVEILRKYHGKLAIAIATAGTRMRTLRFLKAINIDHHYDALVCIDDVPHGKPEPDLFLEAARLLKLPAEHCHVFEDADTGLEAANRAGMSFTDVRTLVMPKKG